MKIELPEELTNELAKFVDKHFVKGESFTITFSQASEKEPKLWEPPGGEFLMSYDSSVLAVGCSFPEARSAGRERVTEQQAIESASASKRRDILEAFRYAGWPDWKADWNDDMQDKWYVKFNHETQKWVPTRSTFVEEPCCVYGPRGYAEETAKMLDEGRLRLS